MSLRSALSIAFGALTLLAVAAAVALVTLTTYLHRTTLQLGNGLESVHLAETTQVALLLHGRTVDPLIRRELDGQIRGQMAQAHLYATTPDERRILDTAGARVDEYLRAPRPGPQLPEPPDVRPRDDKLDAAYRALDAFVDINLAEARSALRHAGEWDRMANRFGTATAILLVLGFMAALSWLHLFILRPLLAVGRAMQNFSEGQRDIRAPQRGPGEICEMAATFNGLADSLAQQRKTQMAFLAGIAHDLRNPLSVMRMSATLTTGTGALPPEPQLRRSLAILARQVNHLERMVSDLLDVTRIEAGQLSLLVAEHDLSEMARHVVELFQENETQHRLRLRAGARTVIRCDAVRIEQVLTNLVSNAIKYSPEGGDVWVELSSDAEHACLSVTDSGVGIPEEDQVHLFEPFQRVLADRKVKGLGLGLFVVKRIVEGHGGTVAVESAPGRGSTFTVRLPMTGTRRETRVSSRQSSGGRRRGWRSQTA